MLKISFVQFVRAVVSWLKESDARDALRSLDSYLKTEIRADFINEIKYDSIFKPLANEAADEMKPKEIDKELFIEDLVDMFIDEDRASEHGPLKQLSTRMMTELKKEGISIEDAIKIIHRGELSPELVKQFRAIKTRPEKLGYAWLANFFHNRLQEWVRSHKGSKDYPRVEVPEEEAEKVELPPEKEVEDEAKKMFEWEEGLLENIFDFLDKKIPEKEKRTVYKKIMTDRLINRKKFEDLVKETGLPQTKLFRYEDHLKKLLAEYVRSRRDIKTFLGPEFIREKEEVDVPEYGSFLKEHPEEQKNLKEWLEQKKGGVAGRVRSDRTLQVLDLYAEGKSTQEIVAETKFPKTTVQDIKNTLFDKDFKEWYMDRVEDIRKAFSSAVQAAVKHIKYRAPGEEEPSDKETSKVHETLVKKALENELVWVTVSFESDYDHMTKPKEYKDPNFKWIHYEAVVDENKPSKKKTYTVFYKWASKLHPDGKFMEGESSLMLDGGKVLENNALKKTLDEHMKAKILPQGVIPHGRFPVMFVNTKTDKKYKSTYDFLRHHDTPREETMTQKGEQKGERLVVHDEPHKQRMVEKKLWEEKKLISPPGHVVPLTDPTGYTNKVRLQHLIDELTSISKKEEDPGAKKRYEEHIKKLKGMLENIKHERWDEIKERVDDEEKLWKGILEDEEKKEKEKKEPKPVYAAVFTEPTSPESKELIELFRKYKLMTAPNPKLWLETKDIVILAKTLRSMIQNFMDKKLKEKRPPDLDKDAWKQSQAQAKEEFLKDIEKAEKYFPEFIKELKARRDRFEHDHLNDFKSLAIRKDVNWVDNVKRVDELISQVKQELREVMKLDKVKQPTMRMLEQGKYDALEGHLASNKKGFSILADRLEEASLNPVGDDESITKLKTNRNKIKEDYKSLNAYLDSLLKLQEGVGLSKEEHDVFVEISSKIKGLKSHLDEVDHQIEGVESIPAAKVAKALQNYADYFSPLYAILTSLVEFRLGAPWKRHDAQEILAVEPEPKEKEPVTKETLEDNLKKLRGKAIRFAEYLSGAPLKASKEIKGALSGLKTNLKNFISGVYDLKIMHEKKTTPSPLLETTKSASFWDMVGEWINPKSILKVIAAAEKQKYDPPRTEPKEELEKKYVIPENVLHDAKKVINRLEYQDKIRENSEEKFVKEAPIAQKELDQLVANLVDTYRFEGSSRDFHDEIKALAEKAGISPAKAAIRLRRHQEAMTGAAMEAFIDVWTDVLKSNEEKKSRPRKEKSPLGNLPAHKYKRIVDYIVSRIKKEGKPFPFAEQEKEEAEPELTIPTPKKLREEIERQWSREKELTHAELITQYKGEFEESLGGTEKAKKRTRKKKVKDPPPSGTWEHLKKEVVDLIKKESPIRMIGTMMSIYADSIKEALTNLKDDEEILLESVIDGFVARLKEIYHVILRMDTHPSSKQMEKPPPDAPQFTGVPDIALDNFKECLDLFNKIKDIYKIINHYIGPDDSVGVPPANLRELRSKKDLFKSFLPRGLAFWSGVYLEREGKAPKTEEYERLKGKPSPQEEKMKEEIKHPPQTGHPWTKEKPKTDTHKEPVPPEGFYLKKVTPARPGQPKYEPPAKTALDFHNQLSANVAKRAAEFVMLDEFEAFIS